MLRGRGVSSSFGASTPSSSSLTAFSSPLSQSTSAKPLRSIYPVIEIGLFAMMNYESYSYAEKIYDAIIPPLFEKHKSSIEELAQRIEQVFKK